MNTDIKPKIDLHGFFQKYGVFLGVGVIVLAEIVLVITLMIPQIFKIYENWTIFKEDSKTVADLATTIQVLSEQNTQALKPYLAKSHSALPEEKKAAGFLTGLTSFAFQHGLTVKAFEFSPGLISTSSAATAYILTNEAGEITTEEGVKATPASLTLSGKITAIKGFLDALKTTSQILSVTTVDYSADSTTLSLLIFYQPLQNTKIVWNQLKSLSAEEINFLGVFPQKDIFKLQTE